ncbi:type II toxin-antitoxin system RelE/ParE family toxin [Paenibacillus thalictri]|uniref:type II toxin-antitoxin system RelE/ParE family toxin n=1 Tax=Paenibacillus thalictri TaxID=2527873 RepID=UPI003B833998
MRQGVFELRPGNYRITYFYWKGEAVCLTVFSKTTNQTPKPEFDRAVARMKDWKRRNP